MDATASDKKAAQPASDGDKKAAQPASDGDKKAAQPASDGASTAPVPSDLAVADASGAADESGGGGGGEDEQVERFYALLANIRAMRDVYGAAGLSSSRKRARVAEPAWRPKFTMEDFREADDAVSGKRGRRDHVERQRPENDDEAEVVRENDRVPASQSTRACIDSAWQATQ